MDKKIPASFITMLIIVLLSTANVKAQPNEPHVANAMWIEPSSVDLRDQTIGYRFNVTVWVNCTGYSGTIGGWQFKMLYNKAYLDAIGCGYTNATAGKSQFFEKISTISVTPTYGSFNATQNYVQHGESWKEGPVRGPGYGSLSWVEFNVTETPPEVVTFTLDISTAQQTADTYVLDWDTVEEIPLTPYNATVIIPEFAITLYLLMALMTSTILSLVIKKSLKPQKSQN
jgi:hypothetical protein